jgi:hypothetical protein
MYPIKSSTDFYRNESEQKMRTQAFDQSLIELIETPLPIPPSEIDF